MKINSFSKRFISMFLIVALGVQSVAFASASSNSVIQNALYNYTPPSSVTVTDSNGKTVKSMYYSGGYYFRFNQSSKPEPLWSFSPPSIEAGCNGFNMKGMFVSMLGLDQFGAMLQNAGTTLAYGVAVGLIYSLPGVASVFKMINQWAKDIQKLLSMACSSGIAIGQAIGEKIGKGFDAQEKIKTFASSLDSSEMLKTSQEGVSAKIKSLGFDTLSFGWDTGFSFSAPTELSPEKKKDLLVGPIQQMIGDVSIGGSLYMDYLLKSVTNSSYDKIVAHLNGSSAADQTILTRKMVLTLDSSDVPQDQDFHNNNVFYENVGAIQNSFSTLEEKDAIGLKFLGYALYYNIAGDTGLTQQSADNIIDLQQSFSCSQAAGVTSGSSKSGTNVNQVSASKNDCEKELADQMFSQSNAISVDQVGNQINFVGGGKIIYDFIMNGVDPNATGDKKIKKIMAPEFLIVSLKEKNSAVKSFAITPTEPNTGTSFFGTEVFGGVENISKCSLYNELDGVIPETYIEDLKKDDKGNAIDCANYPNLMFGDIKVYSDILYKAKDSEIADGVALIKSINEYLLAEALIENIASILYVDKTSSEKIQATAGAQTKSKSPHVKPSEAEELLLEKKKSFGNSLAESKKILNDKYKDIASDRNKAKKYFEDLQRKISERSFKLQK